MIFRKLIAAQGWHLVGSRPIGKIRVKTGHFDQILNWHSHASRHRLGL